MDPTKQLRKFNEMGYADENAKYVSNGKGGYIIKLTDDKWTYEDEFYGGEPYSGNETVWFENKECFRCVYWGKVSEGINFADIYNFLRSALRKGPNGQCVHRGPQCYVENDLIYTNNTVGDIESFQTIERIFKKDIEVYTAWFIGGLISIDK